MKMKMRHVASRIGCLVATALPMTSFCFDFDVSASYAPLLTLAKTPGVDAIGYTRFLAIGLDLGVLTSIGFFELRTLSGFKASPFFQNMNLYSLGFRQYLYRQGGFGPPDFWNQTSLRVIEPYYFVGFSRVEESSEYVNQAETVDVVTFKAWGPTVSFGGDWFLGRKSLDEVQSAQSKGSVKMPRTVESGTFTSLFAEIRVIVALWPETIPAFTFYQSVLALGYRHRF